MMFDNIIYIVQAKFFEELGDLIDKITTRTIAWGLTWAIVGMLSWML